MVMFPAWVFEKVSKACPSFGVLSSMDLVMRAWDSLNAVAKFARNLSTWSFSACLRFVIGRCGIIPSETLRLVRSLTI